MPLGYHVNKNTGGTKSMSEALATASENLASWGVSKTAMQIFAVGPQNHKPVHIDIQECKKVIREKNITLVIHGSYVDNPWKRAKGAIHNIKQEMRIAAQLGASGVIVHLGTGALDLDNFRHVMSGLATNEITGLGVTLWLEIHSAKQSDATYETPEKIAALFEKCKQVASPDGVPLKIGLCIDTAHLYACGLALTDYDTTSRWLAALPANQYMLHLNDCATPLGSGRDQHERLLYGNIWDAYHPDLGLPIENSGLLALLEWAESNSVITILERKPEHISADLMLIHNLGFFMDK